MNILLTGSSGFLGKYFVNELIEYTNLYTLSRKNSFYNYQLDSEIPQLDCHFDLIIHSAGKAHNEPKTETEIAELFKINVDGTQNLLAGISKNKIPKQFVFISSVSVYGLITGENINELAPLMAKDPYGKSKILAEEIVQNWCFENNVICTILRLPLIVGANPPGNLGAMIFAISKSYYFNISHGTAIKSMVLAADIAKCILKVAEVGGTYNLADGCHPSFSELSRCIARQMGKKFVPNLPMFVVNMLAFIGDKLVPKFPINSCKVMKITSSLTFNDSKARKAFAWNPTPVLKGFKICE